MGHCEKQWARNATDRESEMQGVSIQSKTNIDESCLRFINLYSLRCRNVISCKAAPKDASETTFHPTEICSSSQSFLGKTHAGFSNISPNKKRMRTAEAPCSRGKDTQCKLAFRPHYLGRSVSQSAGLRLPSWPQHP